MQYSLRVAAWLVAAGEVPALAGTAASRVRSYRSGHSTGRPRTTTGAGLTGGSRPGRDQLARLRFVSRFPTVVVRFRGAQGLDAGDLDRPGELGVYPLLHSARAAEFAAPGARRFQLGRIRIALATTSKR